MEFRSQTTRAGDDAGPSLTDVTLLDHDSLPAALFRVGLIFLAGSGTTPASLSLTSFFLRRLQPREQRVMYAFLFV